jgi:hypothetical protein
MDLLVSDGLCNSQLQSESTDVHERPLNESKTGDVLVQPAIADDTEAKIRKEVTLRFEVPIGKVSQLYGTMNFLQTKFGSLEIEIKATNGYISEDDYVKPVIL